MKPPKAPARLTDPDTSHDVKVDLARDRREAFALAREMLRKTGAPDFIRREFKRFAVSTGLSDGRAESLRRRLSDLIRKPPGHPRRKEELERLEVPKNDKGKDLRRDGQQILRVIEAGPTA